MGSTQGIWFLSRESSLKKIPMSEDFINRKVHTHKYWKRPTPVRQKGMFCSLTIRDMDILFAGVKKKKRVKLKREKLTEKNRNERSHDYC